MASGNQSQTKGAWTASGDIFAVSEGLVRRTIEGTSNEKAFASIEAWRTRPLEGDYPYVFVDGIYLKRSWGGSYENVAVLVPIGVNSAGDREVIGCAEGYTESADSRREFFSRLKGRGLSGVRLVTGDKCAGMLGALEEVFPGPATSAARSTSTATCWEGYP